jgi:hypothetical protein
MSVLFRCCLALILLQSAAFANATQTSRQRLAQSSKDEACEQVIVCGTKDGKRKEYSTPCAARADGAIDIKPKTGPTCEASQ